LKFYVKNAILGVPTQSQKAPIRFIMSVHLSSQHVSAQFPLAKLLINSKSG